jgi:hypothetical protein
MDKILSLRTLSPRNKCKEIAKALGDYQNIADTTGFATLKIFKAYISHVYNNIPHHVHMPPDVISGPPADPIWINPILGDPTRTLPLVPSLPPISLIDYLPPSLHDFWLILSQFSHAPAHVAHDVSLGITMPKTSLRL